MEQVAIAFGRNSISGKHTGRLKKVIAGVVTVSLLVGIGDAVSMVPLQEDMGHMLRLRVKRYDGVFDPVGTDGKTGEYPDLYTGRNGETCADRNGESS